MTERDLFCTVVSNGPLLNSDAVIILCGEDAQPRLSVAAEVMRSNGAKWVVLSGGLDEPPRLYGADSLVPPLMACGVAPGRIITDNDAMNTHEQAVNSVAKAVENNWHRLLIVASGYHQYRAYLTFIRTLMDEGLDREIQIVNLPASHVPWWGKPEGSEETRVDLLATEFDKIADYEDHVASYADGLTYLWYWENNEPPHQGDQTTVAATLTGVQ